MRAIALAALFAVVACKPQPPNGHATLAAIDSFGVHLAVKATAGTRVDCGSATATVAGDGTANLIVPLGSLPKETNKLGVAFVKSALFGTASQTVTVDLPVSGGKLALWPFGEKGPWVRIVEATGGATSQVGTLSGTFGKTPIRLDDRGDCQLTLWAASKAVLTVAGQEARRDQLGYLRTSCAALFANATYEFSAGDDKVERQDLHADLDGSDQRIYAERSLLEEHLAKRMAMAGGKVALFPPSTTAKRAAFRDTLGTFHYYGPSSPLALLAVGRIDGETKGTPCTNFTLPNALSTNAAAKKVKKLDHIFVQVEVRLYDRSGKELGYKAFPGGASGCPKEVTAQQMKVGVRDYPKQADLDEYIGKALADLKQ